MDLHYIVIASEARQSMIMRGKLWIATSEYRLAKTENESFVIQSNRGGIFIPPLIYLFF